MRSGLSGRHARNALELLELLLLHVLQLLLQRAQMRLSVRHALLAPGQLRQLALDLLLRRQDALLDLRDASPPLGQLAFDFGTKPDRLLPRFDLRLATNGLCLTLGLREQQFAHSPGRADA